MSKIIKYLKPKCLLLLNNRILRNKVSIATIISIIILVIYQSRNSYHVNEILDHYDFKTAEQKSAIKYLFSEAGINTDFPVEESQEKLVLIIIKLQKEAQSNFMNRSGTKERWETGKLHWVENKKQQNLEALKKLGFVDQITPTQRKVDAVCILGATAPRMLNRINYADWLIDSRIKTNAIILLAGERFVTEQIDGTADELTKIAGESGIKDWKKLTETNLIKHIYRHSTLYGKKITHYVIDTPKRDLARPTTQTTILELIHWLKQHNDIKNVIFISNQPYVKYQSAIIDLILKEQNCNIQYEIVGDKAQDLNDLQPIIEGLGSYIWAVSPTVLTKLGIQNISPNTKETLKKMYEKTPLIYKSLPANLLDRGGR